MSWRLGSLATLLVGGLAVLLCARVSPEGSRTDTTVSEPATTQPESDESSRRVRSHSVRNYSGVVTAIDEEGFELRAGWRASEIGGVARRQLDNTETPIRIWTTNTILGVDLREQHRMSPYSSADLRVGDHVSIKTIGNVGGEAFAMQIEITRRPGGHLPPWSNNQFPDHGVHLQFQAYQDWEEKGMPIPAKYLDRDGRAPTNPPYPPEAPMPRPVRP